jgi:hypothetical protein
MSAPLLVLPLESLHVGVYPKVEHNGLLKFITPDLLRTIALDSAPTPEFTLRFEMQVGAYNPTAPAGSDEARKLFVGEQNNEFTQVAVIVQMIVEEPVGTDFALVKEHAAGDWERVQAVFKKLHLAVAENVASAIARQFLFTNALMHDIEDVVAPTAHVPAATVLMPPLQRLQQMSGLWAKTDVHAADSVKVYQWLNEDGGRHAVAQAVENELASGLPENVVLQSADVRRMGRVKGGTQNQFTAVAAKNIALCFLNVVLAPLRQDSKWVPRGLPTAEGAEEGASVLERVRKFVKRKAESVLASLKAQRTQGPS